jgi:Zn-dependent protease with chaperone function
MVRAHYQDGRSTLIREVNLSVTDGGLTVVGAGVDFCVPFEKVAVDERLGRAPRRLRFPDGTFCEVRDLDALDALLLAGGHRDGWIDRLQRHLPSVLVSLLAFAALMTAAYLWVLPRAVGIVTRHIPQAVDVALSAQALKVLDGGILKPSTLTQERRQDLTAAFGNLRLPDNSSPRARLLFRSATQLHANAFTLPDSTIVVLDDLVTTLGSDDEVLAVLSHELGHAHERHGLQMLLRNSIVAAFWTFYIGDISGLLAAVPAAVLQARYSQDFERQADDYGARVLRRNGLSPGLLADALEKLQKLYPESSGGGYLSSHPATGERMKHLRADAAPESKPK